MYTQNELKIKNIETFLTKLNNINKQRDSDQFIEDFVCCSKNKDSISTVINNFIGIIQEQKINNCDTIIDIIFSIICCNDHIDKEIYPDTIKKMSDIANNPENPYSKKIISELGSLITSSVCQKEIKMASIDSLCEIAKNNKRAKQELEDIISSSELGEDKKIYTKYDKESKKIIKTVIKSYCELIKDKNEENISKLKDIVVSAKSSKIAEIFTSILVEQIGETNDKKVRVVLNDILNNTENENTKQLVENKLKNFNDGYSIALNIALDGALNDILDVTFPSKQR